MTTVREYDGEQEDILMFRNVMGGGKPVLIYRYMTV